jgi:hypothetical protein
MNGLVSGREKKEERIKKERAFDVQLKGIVSSALSYEL